MSVAAHGCLSGLREPRLVECSVPGDWSFSRLERELGDRCVPVKFVDKLGVARREEHRAFNRWAELDGVEEGLVPTIRGLELGACPSLARSVAGSAQERYRYTRGLFCGLRGSVTALHADERDNRLAILAGAKAVFLISPEDARGISMMELAGLNTTIMKQLGAPLLRKFRPGGGGVDCQASTHNIAGVTIHSFLVLAGFQLEIPRFWLHCVQNLSDCIGVSAWDRVRMGRSATRCVEVARSPSGSILQATGSLPQTLWSVIVFHAFSADPRGIGSLAAVSKRVQIAVADELLWEAVLRQRWLSEPKDFTNAEPVNSSRASRRNFTICQHAEEAICKLLDLPLRRYRGIVVGERGNFAENLGVLSDPFDNFSGQQVGWLLYAHCFRSGETAREKVGKLLGGDIAIQSGGQAKNQAPEMLQGFMTKVDMAGCSLVVAIRNLLQVLRLPGEAALIETLLEAFAVRFSEIGGDDEEETAMNVDAAFVLCFSLIMLNTDLHNPGIQNKMTERDFVAPNRGINNNGMNVSDQLIRGYYRSIASGSLYSVRSSQQSSEPEPAPARRCELQ